jgi:lysophospholipase-3
MLASSVSQEWKDKYIESFISLGGTFGGSPKSSMSLVIGTTFGLPIVTRSFCKEMLRRMGGLVWMLPPLDANGTLLTTDARSYGNNQLDELFHDLNASTTYEIIKHEFEIKRDHSPGTKVHCIYGHGVQTPVEFKMPDLSIEDHEEEEIVRYVDGDLVVPTYSLQMCDALQNGQKEKVHVHRFENTTHMSVIEEERIWKRILDITTY